MFQVNMRGFNLKGYINVVYSSPFSMLCDNIEYIEPTDEFVECYSKLVKIYDTIADRDDTTKFICSHEHIQDTPYVKDIEDSWLAYYMFTFNFETEEEAMYFKMKNDK